MRKTSPTTSSSPVTNRSFQDRGRRYIAEHGGDGFLIAQREGRRQGVHYEATPLQWQAWRNYRITLGLATRFMDDCGAWGRPWTVPAAWPAEFDPPTDELADAPARAYRADIDG
jgi:hypothetical protein